MHQDAGKEMIPWKKFKDQFVIVLIADGFKELTDSKAGKPFPENAKLWGIFDENLVKNNFYKKDKDKIQRIFSIEEIAEEVIRLDPETAQFDIEALLEMDDYLNSKGRANGYTSKGPEGMQRTHDPIMNLLHCFQNTIPIKHEDFRIDFEHVRGHENIDDDLLEVNFITAVKHLNNKKIDSHLYFFRGFCEYLEPEFCMLVDIGTKPLRQSINKLYEHMWANDDIGGACGDMGVDLKIAKGNCILNYAQYMEYLLSHYIDKAFEGFFSY